MHQLPTTTIPPTIPYPALTVIFHAMQLAALPAEHFYVGKTNLSISDVRAWNAAHHTHRDYELHRNDCRHYVNSLVKYSTGMEGAARSCLNNQLHRHKQQYGLAGRFIQLGQFITDVSNWQRVKVSGRAESCRHRSSGGRGLL